MRRLITPPASSPLEILNIVVSDGTDAITGASVTIDDTTVVTGDDGAASFELEYGDYTCTVACTGYESVTESLSFRSNHKNFTITLTESGGGDVDTDTLTIKVVNGLNVGINNVSVTINGETKTTDFNGDVSFELPYDTYECTVLMGGKDPVTQSITFDSTHKSFTITINN